MTEWMSKLAETDLKVACLIRKSFGCLPILSHMLKSVYNLYFKRVTPITMKSILPSGPLNITHLERSGSPIIS